MKQKQLQLDEEERQFLQDFECEEFESLKNFGHEKRQLEAAAKRLSRRASATQISFQ